MKLNFFIVTALAALSTASPIHSVSNRKSGSGRHVVVSRGATAADAYKNSISFSTSTRAHKRANANANENANKKTDDEETEETEEAVETSNNNSNSNSNSKSNEVTDTDEETVDTAEETVDTAEETVDTAEETVDAAEETVDAAEETVDTAEETVDTAEETVDTAEESEEEILEKEEAGKALVKGQASDAVVEEPIDTRLPCECPKTQCSSQFLSAKALCECKNAEALACSKATNGGCTMPENMECANLKF